jgi:hypothetical protein
MNEIKKVSWSVTATTIYCEAVDDEVTLLVYKNGTSQCASSKKYINPDKTTARKLKEKNKKLGCELRCEGESCSRHRQYRDKLFAEEGPAPE